jgi:superfamily II DNA or RNA helicase
VLATGLGKTWLSAFDSRNFKRVLFIAHREEILGQALATFRAIRPEDRLGRYSGTQKDSGAPVLFASIQTLSRVAHLRKFDPEEFDYIVVDEFHHAEARTYRKVIDYFRPYFLLGLTATPERSDGADLLALCDDNLVYRCDLTRGIREALLCPFRYFGVPDTVDYRNIPWRSRRFDEDELTEAVATKARAENILDQYRKRAGKRGVGKISPCRGVERSQGHVARRAARGRHRRIVRRRHVQRRRRRP